MSEAIITVENLGKRYRIGASPRNEGLRHRLEDACAKPFHWLKNLASRRASPVSASAASTDEEFWALKDVSFEVQRGEVLGIIGRNGAGKSTLLKILSRITEPTEGRIHIRGRVASLLEVGTGFHPELTGRENIFLNGTILGMRRDEIKAKFDEIVAFAEIERFIDTPVKRYSSGMYVRLAFAVAAHLEPEILVVDEVLAVGDTEFQKKCLGKMQDVSQKEGRTVLFVSHNMGAVEALCKRGLLLGNGQLIFNDEVKSVVQEYISGLRHNWEGYADLSKRLPTEKGTCNHAEFLSVRIEDSSGNLRTIYRMGETICFRIRAMFVRGGNDFELGVGIFSAQNVYLHCLISNWEKMDPIPNEGMYDIIVRVPQIRLFPGSYFIALSAKLQGGVIDDNAREVLSFQVEEAPIAKGNAYFSRYSHNTQVYVASDWFVEKSTQN